MFDYFYVTLTQILVLFIYIVIGFVLKKTLKLSQDFNKGLSALLVNIFLPFLTFSNISKNFKLDILGEKVMLVIVSTVMVLVFWGIAFLFSRIFAKEQNTRDVYLYSFTFPNSGYIGNPLVLAIFGEMLLFDYIIFCIPFLVFTYTFGIYILNPNRSFSFKSLLNPNMLAIVLGMIFGAMDIRIPTFAMSVLEVGGSCMAPSAMILTGVVFAANDVRKMLANKKVYLACVIKMVLLPLAMVYCIATISAPENLAILMITMMALPTGLNSVVFPEAYGGDSRTGAQLCFVSTMTCLLFIPVIFAFYRFLCG